MDDATAALLYVPFVALAANRDCSRPDHYAGFRGVLCRGLSQMRPDWRKSRKSSVATNFFEQIEVNKARGIAGRLIVDFKRV
jgi:hypothetical protein